MNNLYLECASGISGDMAVAALLDLGADKNKLLEALKTVPLSGYKVEISRVKKSGIDCCDFNVILDVDNHDHDMEYLHGHDHEGHHHHEHSHEHCHEHEHEHSHEHHHEHECAHEIEHSHDEHCHHHDHCHDHKHLHCHHHNHEHSHEHAHDMEHSHDEHCHHHDHCHDHEHSHCHHHDHCHDHEHSHCHHHDHEHEHDHSHEHGHHHEHRGLHEIKEIIEKSGISSKAKELANKIFQIIAESEAKSHGMPIDQVHFHEVGAVDSIIDIISFAVCFTDLEINKVYVPKMFEGTGTIRCQHGILPVPVPAVSNIAASYNLNLELSDTKGEFITPTGAAFVAAVKTDNKLPKELKIVKIGLGAGKRNYERPSFLRAMLIQETAGCSDTVVKLESNIDDSTGESLGFTMETLFKNGALDVHYIPCMMKKNRPAYLLTVICNEEDRIKLENIIFEQTTTIGIRRMNMERTKLLRKTIEVETQWGKIKAKEVEINGKPRIYPEYEVISEICRKYNLGFNEVYETIKKQF